MDKNISILVTDDNESIRIVIRRILEKKGYQNVYEVGDGMSAFQLLKSQKIDLIIADWNMPVMSGIELLKKVRQDNEISKTPFIVVSVEGLDVSMETAFQSGVSDFISKPFTAEALIASLEKVMPGSI
ncbi:MAG: response regulator [Deltaproteobacteria bacterium]|nr:response regulator [Deltaproteobacteria bacterium]